MERQHNLICPQLYLPKIAVMSRGSSRSESLLRPSSEEDAAINLDASSTFSLPDKFRVLTTSVMSNEIANELRDTFRMTVEEFGTDCVVRSELRRGEPSFSLKMNLH